MIKSEELFCGLRGGFHWYDTPRSSATDSVVSFRQYDSSSSADKPLGLRYQGLADIGMRMYLPESHAFITVSVY